MIETKTLPSERKATEAKPGNQPDRSNHTAQKQGPDSLCAWPDALSQGPELSAETLLNTVDDLIFAQDLDGHILAINSAVTTLFGYPEQEVIGRCARDFLRDDQKELFQANFLDSIRRDGTYQGISVFLDRDGREHWLECRCKSFRPDRGNPFIIGTGRDVTERIRAEKELAAMQCRLFELRKTQAMATMAGGIAHEFNNILSVIMGNVELAMDEVPSWNPTHLFLDEIYQTSLRARDVVQRLVKCSGSPPSPGKPVLFRPMIEKSLQQLSAMVPGSVRLCTEFEGVDQAILADPAEIHLMLEHLISNALLALGDAGGQLRIGAKGVHLEREQALRHPALQSGRHVELLIRDNGCGIDPKHLDRIFDPFFTTREVGQGSGMGLAIVRGIIKNHGAAIAVASEPGAGTTFSLWFPVTDQTPAPEPIFDPRSAEPSYRILLVDDEAVLAAMGKQMLEKLGYQVESTSSPIQALDLFRSRPNDFDLLITDLTMAELPGDQLAEKILQLRSNLPIIMCSGFSRKMVREIAPSLRVSALLEKPVPQEQLARTIRRLLRRTVGR